MAESLLIFCLLFPFVGVLLFLPTHAFVRNSLIVSLPFFFAFAMFSLAFQFFHSPLPDTFQWTLGSLMPGLNIGFSVEPLGMIFACVLAILWPISMLYALTYLEQNKIHNTGLFCVCFYLAIGCTVGIAFAADLLTLYIFYEALTLVTYPLVTHSKTPQAQRAGLIYLLFLLGTSVLLFLPIIVWMWLEFGTLTFVPGGFIPGDAVHPLLLVLLAFGIGKAALVPLHAWLPTAMVAPAPVSALLHAVAVVKAGVFTFIKVILFVFGPNSLASTQTEWLVYVVGIGIVVASVMALKQNELKHRLAYSTISQLAYIILGAALLKTALLGAILHLVAHAFGKITLFFAAGAIQTMSGKTRIDQMHGIGYAMPWTMAFFAIAAISLVGLPPTAGFISKWFLIQGAIGTQHYFAITVILISTLLNVAYFAPIVYIAYDKKNAAIKHNVHEAPAGLLLPMLISIIGVVGLFFFSQPLLNLVETLL